MGTPRTGEGTAAAAAGDAGPASGPRTAIVTAARDARPWIGAALASALAQTDRDLEVVVVDDGSTDGTGALVEEVARDDPRVRLLTATGRGPGAARNQGVAATRAPFLLFLDADDSLAADALAARHSVLEVAGDAAVAYGDTRVVREEDRTLVRIDHPPRDGAEMVARLLSGGESFYLHAALVRRDWFERAGGFPTRPGVHEDVAVWIRIALLGGTFLWAAATPNEYLLRSGSRSHDPEFAIAGRIELLRMLLDSELPRGARAVVRSRMRERLLLLAGARAARGRLRDARDAAWASLRYARRPGHVRESLACALRPARAARFVGHLPDHIVEEL